jgi:hypothetical protein
MRKCAKHGSQKIRALTSELVDQATKKVIQRGTVVEFFYKGVRVMRANVSDSFAKRYGLELNGLPAEFTDDDPAEVKEMEFMCEQCYQDDVAKL